MNTVGQTYVRGCAQERTRTYSHVKRSNHTGDETKGFAPELSSHCDKPNHHQQPSAEADGGDDRVRTDDPLLAKQVLSQLSYVPGTSTKRSLNEAIGSARDDAGPAPESGGPGRI